MVKDQKDWCHQPSVSRHRWDLWPLCRYDAHWKQSQLWDGLWISQGTALWCSQVRDHLMPFFCFAGQLPIFCCSRVSLISALASSVMLQWQELVACVMLLFSSLQVYMLSVFAPAELLSFDLDQGARRNHYICCLGKIRTAKLLDVHFFVGLFLIKEHFPPSFPLRRPWQHLPLFQNVTAP